MRRHLGMETQRQWSEKAIARTTPALLGLFSLVVLWTNRADVRRFVHPYQALWYQKRTITFSDALAAVRRSLWASELSHRSAEVVDIPKGQPDLVGRLVAVLCRPA